MSKVHASADETGAAALPPRYIFTVSTGRAGQNTLADFLAEHVREATVAFEEPQVRTRMPGRLGVMERRFRRTFFETHELLGRGRVLSAYASGDRAALERYGRDRLAWMERRLAKTRARVFIDVSKHFIHGLHVPLTSSIASFGLIRLTRDPIENMRSYLNRRKDFDLDNNAPNCPANILHLDTAGLSSGDNYLWAWFETQLRYEALKAQYPAAPTFELTTSDLNDAGALERLLNRFGLAHADVHIGGAKNTNRSLGFAETRIRPDDVETFERFLARVPPDLRKQIPFLAAYEPRRVHATSLKAC